MANEQPITAPPVVEAEGKLARTLDKAADVVDSMGVGISQRPTAWTACIIFVSLCITVGWIAYVSVGKLPQIINAMCTVYPGP